LGLEQAHVKPERINLVLLMSPQPTNLPITHARADWIDQRERKKQGEINARSPDFKKRNGGSECGRVACCLCILAWAI
jgi:hypothetical protein